MGHYMQGLGVVGSKISVPMDKKNQNGGEGVYKY
jgi:hypothetical protein